ncbi:hypothetical protein BT63DRAFT_456403 [Microthyrium microscopicum]|uniref:Uncharacterized protein n=1 Tax=Microthyrium microscopicum TaxID=703497 RepID=A0A6A6U9A6_9PEZI|nr:hypothetical protein BT63DRAFT_456403 [Microthyrium microscopicum]
MAENVIEPRDQVVVVKGGSGRLSRLKKWSNPTQNEIDLGSPPQRSGPRQRKPDCFRNVLNLSLFGTSSSDSIVIPKCHQVTFVVVFNYDDGKDDNVGEYKPAILALDPTCNLRVEADGRRLIIDRPASTTREALHVQYYGNFVLWRARPCVHCDRSGFPASCDSRVPCQPCYQSNTTCVPQSGALDVAKLATITSHSCFRKKHFKAESPNPPVVLADETLPPCAADAPQLGSSADDALKHVLEGLKRHTLKREYSKVLIMSSLPGVSDPDLLEKLNFDWDKAVEGTLTMLEPTPRKQGKGKKRVHDITEEVEDAPVDEQPMLEGLDTATPMDEDSVA